MRWLLVSASTSFSGNYPMGLGYISAMLKHKGYAVSCLDLIGVDASKDRNAIREALLESRADILGVGGLSRDYRRIKSVLTIAKEINPDIVCVVGGGVVSSQKEVLFGLDADYGVLDEGEEIVCELTEHLIQRHPVETIKGLLIKRDGQVFKTQDREPPNINAIPFPDRVGFDLNVYLDREFAGSKWIFNTDEDYPRGAAICLSRSCPFHCTFCFHSSSKYRVRELDNVFQELDELCNSFDFNYLEIYDDLFATKLDRLNEFCARIKQYNLKWVCQIRVGLIDEKIAKIARDAGCIRISYGFESFSKDVLLSMKKKILRSDIEKACEITYKNNIDIQGNFIFGDSKETLESVNETIGWWVKHRKYAINLVALDVYPGTGVFHEAIMNGVIKNTIQFVEQGCPSVNLTKFSDSDRQEILRKMSIFFTVVRTPGTIRSFRFTEAKHGIFFCAVEMICPHCGQLSSYASLPFSVQRVVCKVCYGRIDPPIRQFIGRRIPMLLPSAEVDLLRQSLVLLKDQQLASSYQILSDITARYSNDDLALSMKGIIELYQGEFAQAERTLLASLSTNFASADTMNNYAISLYAFADVGFALLCFSQALVLEKDHPEAWYNIEYIKHKHDITAMDKIEWIRVRDSKRLDTSRLKIAVPHSVDVCGYQNPWLPLKTDNINPAIISCF